MKIVLLTLFLSFVFFSCSSPEHVCYQLDSKFIEHDGNKLSDAGVYQCDNNQRLIWLEDNGAILGVWGIDFNKKKIGAVNLSDLVRKSDRVIYYLDVLPMVFPEDAEEGADLEQHRIFEREFTQFQVASHTIKVMN